MIKSDGLEGNVYASKIKERLTAELRTKDLPFTIIADKSTDPHSNQEILSLCLRFVDQSSPNDVKECLTNFMHLERTNATMISRKILKSLSDPSISLDPSNIRGQAYDGASVMSSGKEGVQAKIKEISPLALFTHCYAHCLNLSIAASCKLSEVRNLIGLINEAYLFLITAQSDSSCLSWLWKNACLRIPTVSFQVYARHAGWKDTRA